jgi:AAA family ATP:ADP antiporter
MPNPFKAIMNVRRRELPLALLMFSYFFLVISSFWVLKPLKKSLFIQYYDQTGVDIFSWHLMGSQAELIAKVLNMAVAGLAVTIFTLLARHFRRQQLTFIFCLFFMAAYVVYGRVINEPGDLTIWTFYLFGDLFATLMVATFFAFLNDSVTPDAAKRLYGLIGLGGVCGGVFGSSFVRIWIDRVAVSQWLWITFGIAAVIIAIAFCAGRLVRLHPPPYQEQGAQEETTAGGNPALEGARLVFRSSYLLSIVAIVGLYEITSTLMDFQFTATIEHYLDGDAIGRQFSTMFTITNIISMLVQFFLTSFIMTRFGLTTALLILPAAILTGSCAFFVFPFLWVGSFLNTADNGFSYSINQSAKETLYVPTSRDEKYKAKAFIDMFVQRFAKAIAVGISLGITTLFQEFGTIRYLSIATAIVIVIWIFAARYAGRTFHGRTQ